MLPRLKVSVSVVVLTNTALAITRHRNKRFLGRNCPDANWDLSHTLHSETIARTRVMVSFA
jgi:hypothetical protein